MQGRENNIIDFHFEEITKLNTFVELSWFGFDYARNASRVVEALNKSDNEIKKEKLKKALKLERFAEEQQNNGFSYLYILALIRLWSILEACIDELVIEVLFTKKMKTNEYLNKIKGNLFEFVQLSEKDQAEYLLESLKSETKASLKLGVGRFENLLETVGYAGHIPNTIKKNILEMSQIRNIIVHKNGRVDSRLLKNCPWLNYKLDDEIQLNGIDFHKYQMTCYYYLVDICLRYEYEDKQDNYEEVYNLREELLVGLENHTEL